MLGVWIGNASTENTLSGPLSSRGRICVELRATVCHIPISQAGVEIGVDTSTAALAQPAPSSTPAQPGIGSPAAQAVPASSALTGPAHDTRESSPRQPHVHKTIDSIQVIRDASCEGHTVVLYPLRVRAVSPNKTPGHAAGHQAVTAGPQVRWESCVHTLRFSA